jgi:hypothetical protein
VLDRRTFPHKSAYASPESGKEMKDGGDVGSDGRDPTHVVSKPPTVSDEIADDYADRLADRVSDSIPNSGKRKGKGGGG